MESKNHYDVIIIGSGAGGGTLTYHLASSGKRILLLERGDYVPREKDNWNSRAVNAEGKYNTKEIWHDRDGKELHPHTNYYVGGNTKFYGAALFRLRREDFGEVKHDGGVSPAWPIAYEDLEPYYTRAEQLYHVHGERGADPTDPPAGAPYPHPPVSHEPRIQQLADDWARLGRRPFHVPLGVMLDEANPRKSACIRCATCDGHVSRQREVGRSGGVCGQSARARERDAPHERAREAPRDQRVRSRGYADRRRPPGRHRDVRGRRRRRRVRRDQLRSAAPALGERAASARARQRLRCRRAPLYGPRQLGPHGPFPVPQSHGLSEDARAQRLLLRLGGVGLSDGPHLLRGQARRRHAPGGRARHRAGLHPRSHGPALARLLAHLRGPARSGQPRDPRP